MKRVAPRAIGASSSIKGSCVETADAARRSLDLTMQVEGHVVKSLAPLAIESWRAPAVDPGLYESVFGRWPSVGGLRIREVS